MTNSGDSAHIATLLNSAEPSTLTNSVANTLYVLFHDDVKIFDTLKQSSSENAHDINKKFIFDGKYVSETRNSTTPLEIKVLFANFNGEDCLIFILRHH
jgi:hypothetical protein